MNRRMLRRIGLVFGTAALLTTSFPTAPVEAAYYGGCLDSQFFGNFQLVNIRDSSGPYTGAIMELNARHLEACTQQSNFGSATYVPDTLQQSYTDLDHIVQMGIGKCTVPGGCGGDADGSGAIPSDGAVHFWYTKYDSQQGRVYLADSWYGAAPSLAHRYRLKIEDDGANWGYYIRDVTANQAYVIHNRDQHWSSPQVVWWGGEVFVTNDAMGSPYPLYGDLSIESQYRSGGNWYQTNGADQLCQKDFNFGTLFPSYFTCSYTTVDVSKDRQQIRTIDH